MSIYLYILVMALTTYLIRALPLTIFRGRIKNRFVRSFLAYVPCACLAAMTFPAILYATDSVVSGAIGLVAAIGLAFWGKSLVTVAACSCLAVYLTELALRFL
ncbi:MAG: AzlD domain-containing protein [Ruminococcaceae bacterium]|nr:AzlD domain-containing protein [Oscillospiraceae bacterium]